MTLGVRSLVIGVVALVVFAASLHLFGSWHDEWSGYNASVSISNGWCNIAIIPVHDEITSYTYYDELGDPVLSSTLDDFVSELRRAEYDPGILGVIVSIDSPGGSPYAGEAMANELMRSSLPSAAVVRDMAASAGYWAATGADRIFASVLSNVGSIGVTMSYLEYAGQNEDSGLSYVEIASGPYKDAGNPDKRLSEEERALFQRDVDETHLDFVQAVARNRNLSEETVASLADGSTMLGRAAFSAGLIDELGDRESARVWFATELGLTTEEVILCE